MDANRMICARSVKRFAASNRNQLSNVKRSDSVSEICGATFMVVLARQYL